MRKLFLSIALLCATTNFFAQTTDPAQLRQEGLDAIEAKDYQTAFTKLSSFMDQTNNQDSVIAYNLGIYADKLKKPADAAKYFDIAIQKKYNTANAYIGKAGALKDLNKLDEYVACLKEGLAADPGNKQMTRMYANHYVNQGVRAQKAKKTDAAEGFYKQAVEIQPENINALNALAGLFYGKGAAKMKANDQDGAKAEFAQAKEYIGKLLPLLKANNPKQKKLIDNANTMLNYINSIK